MSPDGRTIAWTLAHHIELPVDWAVVSQDGGEHWQKIIVYDLTGQVKTTGGFKIFADRVANDTFYAFGDHSDLYVSTDRARTFRQLPTPAELPEGIHFAKIDCANGTEIRGEAGKTGHFLMALGFHGLWTLDYQDGTCHVHRLSKVGDQVFRAGYGLGRPGGDYITEHKAIYLNGVIGGAYGFYRTLDDGQTFVRLNTGRQMYGHINSIDGDCREFGLFYLATGCKGLVYGRPQT